MNVKTKQARFFFLKSTITDVFLGLHYEKSFRCFFYPLDCAGAHAVRVKGLPGIDEILGQADVSGGPCDGDLAL